MARKATSAPRGQAKEEARQQGEVDAGGELVREPEIKVVHSDPGVAQAAEKKDDGPSLEERLAGMEKDMAVAKRRAEEAERRAQAAEETAARQTTAAQTSEDAAFRNYKSSVANAETAIVADLAAAKAAYAQAMEAGDFNKAADAQEAIAVAANKQVWVNGEKQRIADWEKRPKQETPAAQPQARPDLRQMPRAAREYLQEHPEYLDDTRLWNRLSRAHGDALDDGLEPYGDDYFAFIDQRMGNTQDKKAASRATRSDAALPPSRSGPSTSGTRSAAEVSLTAREVEAAHFSYPELPHADAEIEYAKQKRRLESEGKIGTRH